MADKVYKSSNETVEMEGASKAAPEGTEVIYQAPLPPDEYSKRSAQASELPTNFDKVGNINWLGSSYTGQDIKVVAHLYNNPNSTKNVQEALLRKEGTAREIVTFTNSLNTGRLSSFFTAAASLSSWADIREAFLGGTEFEFTEAKETVLTILGDFRSVSGRSQMRGASLNMFEVYTSLVNSYEAQITAMNNNKAETFDTLVLATLQTISLSTYREKFPVRALGHHYAKNYTRGARTIAGSMIFTVFEEHPLTKLINAMATDHSGQSPSINQELSSLLPDQLPPIDLTIVFANEYGSLSQLRLLGVEFVSDGLVLSTEDLLSENTMEFVARDADIMLSKGNVLLSKLLGPDLEIEQTATDLLFSTENYDDYIQTIGVRRGLLNR